jgi:glutaconate CoA-transferase subunit A
MDVIDQGQGPLFTDQDPDAIRAHFRKKSRKMVNKVIPLKEAVSTYVKDGEYLGLGGFGTNRVPMAACHEIVRQGKKNMGFAGHTSSHDMQILSAGEVYDKLDVAYVVGMEARGLSLCSRAYIQSGRVSVVEWTNYSLTIRMRAAAMGVPFLPTRNMMGTDTFKYSGAKTVECPFTGKKLVLLPALAPDVAFIHVHEADMYGNARFKGIAVADLDLAGAAKHLIITAERIITTDEVKNDPSRTRIPFHMVDAVCEVPFGCYPGNMAYEYFSDEEHLQEWMAAERDPDVFREFMQKNVYDCKDHDEYIQKNGGMARMRELRAKELFLMKEDR